MGSQLPYRLPCEAVAGKPRYFLGGPFQHKRGPEHENKYANSTQVSNWDTSEGAPATIPPYERFTPDESGDGSCETHFCNPDGAPCAPWPEPVPANVFTHIEGDLVDFAIGRKRGWKAVQGARSWHGALPWTAPEHGCKTDLCADGVTGFQAYQPDPSQVKYLTAIYDCHIRNHFDAGEDAGGYLNCDKTGARTVNAQSGEITSTLSTSEEDAANFGSGAIVTFHVENGAGHSYDDTGAITATYRRDGTTVLDSIDNDLHCSHPRVRADAEFDLPGFISAWNAAHATPMPLMTDPNSYSCGITSSDADGDWTVDAAFSRNATVVSWHFTLTQNNGTDEDNTWEYYGTITLSDPNYGNDVLTDIYNLLSLWPLNDDHLYPWRTDRRGSVAPYVTRKEVANTSPLGFNFYYVDDLTSPTDDADGNAPFSPGWSPTYDLRAWFDDRIYIWLFPDGMDSSNSAATSLYKVYDGSVLGAPKPAGYQNYFDFLFQDIRACCQRPGDGSQTWAWYQVGWGMNVSDFNSLSDTQLPLNATQWNSWFMAANKPAGAWIIYADQSDYFPADCVNSSADAHSGAGDTGKIVACKYAEILERWPSQDFALPAGDMKFWHDETRVFCATNVSGSGAGSVWALTDPTTGSPPSTLDPDSLWGGPVVEGFYAISAYAAGVVTLGAKQYDVPGNWTSKSNGDDATCFGPLRWPGYPSLLGRAAIAADLAGTTFTFAVAQPAFGMNSSTHQEQIDLYDSTMALVASDVTATRISDTQFSTVAPQPSAVFITIHGAPAKWYMDDTSSKGDWTVLQWWFDYRAIAEGESGRTDCDGNAITVPDTITYPDADCSGSDLTVAFPGHGYRRFCQQQGCLPFVPCSPRVVCISPNGETWNNGITIAMPATMVWDEQYGTRYQAVVESTMTDLFWQPPHFPCNIKSCATWKMDDGSCQPNTPTHCPEVGCPDDAGCDVGSTPPVYIYALAPLVEARLTVPNNYGPSQDESAPALPGGIQIGWLSPVDHADTVAGVAMPPKAPGLSDDGLPGNCDFAWTLHETLCESHDADCRFGYNESGC